MTNIRLMHAEQKHQVVDEYTKRTSTLASSSLIKSLISTSRGCRLITRKLDSFSKSNTCCAGALYINTTQTRVQCIDKYSVHVQYFHGTRLCECAVACDVVLCIWNNNNHAKEDEREEAIIRVEAFPTGN